MEKDNPTSSAVESGADRRKSGRTQRRPELFSQQHHDGSLLRNGSSKRKRRANEEGAEDEASGESDASESEESDESEGEPDEEELSQEAKRSRKKSGKPAQKKAKTNGASTILAMRPANIQSKPATKAAKAQRARARPSQLHREGLYAEVFGRGKEAGDVATDWYQSLEENNVDAIRDLVNFILECIGCETRAESPDIEDIDNVASKLSDKLKEFEQQKTSDYPLISKLKQYSGFRAVLVDFFRAIIQILHTSSVLYENEAVFDNIQTWVATMSGAALRPFRHTATVISLTMSTAFCEIAAELQKSLATARTQLATEKKKKSVNKGRVKVLEGTIEGAGTKIEMIDALLKDSFDTVFVHRYRDVDEKIRVECVNALGTWIELYRKMFLEGQYLRYLGWVLSDPTSATRVEVLKRLKSLFKDRNNIAALRAFTERFRPRIVEMGARDTDTGVRTEAIELLDCLRNAELLEPDDIDTIGRLIFDTEPRVRKSVSKFFVSNIEDLYKSSIEDMDAEQFETILPKQSDSYVDPSQSWIKYKCLAQTLTGYDSDAESTEQAKIPKGALIGEDLNSRYMLATQAIFPYMEELHEWEDLAGYLLYDHSQITAEADDVDVGQAVQGTYKLETGEERALLDVLFFAVKLYLEKVTELPPDKKGKKTQASKDAVQRKRETTAQNLTEIIPELLNKFGSTPSAAASILRLEQLLNIDLLSDFSQGDSTYSTLLDDINKQFVSHSDQKVLAEASKALRQVRSYEQSKEAADAKIQEIWDDSTETLLSLLKNQNVDTRGTLPIKLLTEISHTVARLAYLAGVSDCATQVEKKATPTSGNRRKSKVAEPSLFELFLRLSKRGVDDEDSTAGFAEVEDELCLSVITILSLYFRWKVVGIKNAISAADFKSLITDILANISVKRDSFIEGMTPIISSRVPLDPVRISALQTVFDVFTLFSTLRHAKPSKGVRLPEEVVMHLNSLMMAIPEDLQAAMMQTHERLERSFAKKTRRKLERAISAKPEVAVDDAPVDSDDERDDDEVDDDDDELDGEEDHAAVSKNAKKQAALLAEQSLCEVTSKIVLGIIGLVVDEGAKDRVMTNRTKLGLNYRSVVGYLEEKEKPKATKKVLSKEKPKAKERKSEQMVLEDDDIEDDEMERPDEELDQALHDRELADDEENEDENVEGNARPAEDEVDEVMGD